LSLLLDTHIYLWWLDSQLSREAHRLILESPDVFISAASLWEVGIKVSIGKLSVDLEAVASVEADGFQELPISVAHARYAASLPLHHRDPFDRMLVAQARLEGLTLVTADKRLSDYGGALHLVKR